MIMAIIIARILSVMACSFILNLTRKDNIIDKKKQFFLVFAGIRGAMAYALSIKSIGDFKDDGKKFVIITLIFTGISLLYSSFLVEWVSKKCGIVDCPLTSLELTDTDCNGKVKLCIQNFNNNYLLKFVHRNRKISANLDTDNSKEELITSSSKKNNSNKSNRSINSWDGKDEMIEVNELKKNLSSDFKEIDDEVKIENNSSINNKNLGTYRAPSNLVSIQKTEQFTLN